MNTTNVRRISAAAAIVFSLASAGVILAQTPPPQPSGPVQAGPPVPLGRGQMGSGMGQPGASLEWLVRELNLSDSQRASVNTLLQTEHNSVRSQMDSLRQARQGLNSAIMTVPTDDGLLQAQVQQVSTIEAQLALTHARTESKIFQLLTPEQQSHARDLLSQREQQAPRRGRRG
jgi:Spy/CpxP family protein refolding chaperone